MDRDQIREWLRERNCNTYGGSVDPERVVELLWEFQQQMVNSDAC